jgi:hypothetical protein
MKHDLKIWPQYFVEVAAEQKTFEIRKNDRDYQVGDVLRLREWEPLGRRRGYTGREVLREVTYITDYGQQPDNVVMAIRPLPNIAYQPRPSNTDNLST